MSAASATPNVVHVIQLAVAPVFLLSGVGVVLTVLTSRLARVIDRARLLEDRLHDVPGERLGEMHAEMAVLSYRARLVNIALTLATCCALLVCLVIGLLFLGSALRIELDGTISVLFVAAMVALVGSLGVFLHEIYVGTSTLRIGRGSHGEPRETAPRRP